MVEARIRLVPRHIEQPWILPGHAHADDADYDDASRLWNAIHDRRPAVIARPRNPQEVAAAITFGREHDLDIAVQSGGHAAAAFAGPDGSLVINLSNMRGVEADPRTRIAVRTAVPSSVSSTSPHRRMASSARSASSAIRALPA